MRAVAALLGAALFAACGSGICANAPQIFSCEAAGPYAGPPLHVALSADTFPSASSPDLLKEAVPAELAALLDARVDAILRQTGLPAVSAAIAIPGFGKWNATRGLAQVAPAKPVDGQTLFYWASVAKVLTAALVLQLVDEGKLHLDDRLARWYPQIPQAERITIEQLLSHTSGLPTNALNPRGEIPQTPEQILVAASLGPNLFCPGLDASYSNTGYLLLALIVQAVDDKPFHEVLRQRVAIPLGLEHLRALRPGEEHPSDVATPHLARIPQTDPGQWSRIGSGNVVARAEDILSTWFALLQGRLLLPATVQRQWAQLRPIGRQQSGQSTMWFGQGVMLTEWTDNQNRHRQWLGHMGGTPTTNSVVLYDPLIKAYVAVAVNSEVSSVAFANALLQVVETWQSEHSGSALELAR